MENKVRNEIIKADTKREIRIYDDKIDDVAKRMAEKMGIDGEKAKTELGMGVIMGMMMNRHRSQEIKEE